MNEKLMTAFQKVAGHRASHDAKSDETDLCHILRLQLSEITRSGGQYDVYHAQVTEGDLVDSLKWPLP